MKAFKQIIKHINIEQLTWVLPVFIFALSQSTHSVPFETVYMVFLLFVLVMPSIQLYAAYSNGAAEGKLLLRASTVIQVLALVLALKGGLSLWILTLIFLGVSRAYYAPSICLKQYAIIRLLLLMVLLGGFIFVLTQFGIGSPELLSDGMAIQATSLLVGAIVSVVLLGEESRPNEGNIAQRIGVKFTLRMAGVLFLFGVIFMAMHFYANRQTMHFYLFMLFFAPVGAFYFWLARHAPKQPHVVNPKMVTLFLRFTSILMGIFAALMFLLNRL